jgi:hypothetical protein
MSGLLGLALGGKGSGRARYGRAMMVYAQGGMNAAQLEAYRVAAAHDKLHPALFLADRGLPLPVALDDQDEVPRESQR